MISDTPGPGGEGGQKRAKFCGRPLCMTPNHFKISVSMAFRSIAARSVALCRRAMATEASGNTFPLTFGSPYKAVHDGSPVKQVDLPSTTGKKFSTFSNQVISI